MNFRFRSAIWSLALLVFSLPSTSSAVMIASVDVTGDSNANTVSTVVRESIGFNLVTGQGNVGDIKLALGDINTPLRQEDGVVIAAPNTYAIVGSNANPRAFVSVPGPLTSSNSFAGAAWLAFTDITSTGSETNFPVDLAYFPFAEGWVGGHISSAGGKLAGNLDTVTITDQLANTPATLRFDATHLNPSNSLMFTIDAENSSSGNVVPIAPTPDGNGWEVSVLDEGNDFPATEAGDFSFVIIPITAPNLIGGHINDDGSTILGVGDFTATPTATTGEMLLKISDGNGGFYDNTDGVLLLTVNKYAEKGNTGGGTDFGPDDNFLVFEYLPSEEGFLVVSHDLPGAGNQTTQWNFAFLRYDAPLQWIVPEPSSLGLIFFGTIALAPALRRRFRRSA